jgi:hypothetical protein
MTSDIDSFDWISFNDNLMVFDPTFEHNGEHSFTFHTLHPDESFTIEFTVDIPCENYGYVLLEPVIVPALGSTTYTIDLLSDCGDVSAPGYSLTNSESWITNNENDTLTLTSPPQDALSYSFKLL